MIGVGAERPVEFTQLGGPLDAACDSLLDVDVGFSVVGGILFGMQGYGCEGEGFARQPADALEGEDGVGVVREGFVLWEERSAADSIGNTV
jgi:hypothetical protein